MSALVLTKAGMCKSIVIAFVIVLTVFAKSYGQTTVIFTPSDKDAWVEQLNSNNNYGNSSNLYVGRDPGGEYNHSYIYWDISSLPSCINITDAEIRVNQQSDNPNTVCVDIKRVTQTWNENSITYNNQPSASSISYGTMCFSSSLGYKNIPVTNLVQDWLIYGNYGVMLYTPSIADPGEYQFLSSKEEGTSSQRPKLTITYTNATPPTASISGNTNICQGVSTTLTASGGTSYLWDTGVTTSSITVSPSISTQYCVTVTDANGCTDQACVTVTVNSCPSPVADFYGSPTIGCAPLSVSFHDQTTNSPTSWSWNFGDGGTSTQQNPSHTYNSADTYTVSLTATNSYGNDNETKSNYITANSCPPPVAEFYGSPLNGIGPLSVSFHDQTTNSPTSWSWNFGDGGTSTIKNPYHTYSDNGYYTVSLTATNSYGNDNETKPNYIYVHGVGIEEISSKYITKIYPNPTKDKLNIEFTDNINKIEKITLSNMLGQTVYTIKGKKINTKNFVIDLSDYKSGVYYLNIRTKEDGTMRNKISVVR